MIKVNLVGLLLLAACSRGQKDSCLKFAVSDDLKADVDGPLTGRLEAPLPDGGGFACTFHVIKSDDAGRWRLFLNDHCTDKLFSPEFKLVLMSRDGDPVEVGVASVHKEILDDIVKVDESTAKNLLLTSLNGSDFQRQTCQASIKGLGTEKDHYCYDVSNSTFIDIQIQQDFLKSANKHLQSSDSFKKTYFTASLESFVTAKRAYMFWRTAIDFLVCNERDSCLGLNDPKIENLMMTLASNIGIEFAKDIDKEKALKEKNQAKEALDSALAKFKEFLTENRILLDGSTDGDHLFSLDLAKHKDTLPLTLNKDLGTYIISVSKEFTGFSGGNGDSGSGLRHPDNGYLAALSTKNRDPINFDSIEYIPAQKEEDIVVEEEEGKNRSKINVEEAKIDTSSLEQADYNPESGFMSGGEGVVAEPQETATRPEEDLSDDSETGSPSRSSSSSPGSSTANPLDEVNQPVGSCSP